MIVPSLIRTDGNGASPRRHSSNRTGCEPEHVGVPGERPLDVGAAEHDVVEFAHPDRRFHRDVLLQTTRLRRDFCGPVRRNPDANDASWAVSPGCSDAGCWSVRTYVRCRSNRRSSRGSMRLPAGGRGGSESSGSDRRRRSCMPTSIRSTPPSSSVTTRRCGASRSRSAVAWCWRRATRRSASVCARPCPAVRRAACART